MSENNNQNEQNGIMLTRKHIVIIIAVIIFLLFAAVFIGLNFNKWFGDKDEGSSAVSTTTSKTPQNVDIDPNAGVWTGSKPQDDTSSKKQTGIKIPGYPSIKIAKNSENVRIALVNPEGNPCYFKFTIVLKDTKETIYESKYVAPGQAITEEQLTRGLDAGEYKATIMISTLSLDGSTPMNGANVETVLIAQ